MAAPVPKPRAIYRHGNVWRSSSTESTVSASEELELNKKLEELKRGESEDINKDGIIQKMIGLLTPPLTPSDSTSDSSADEFPVASAPPPADEPINIKSADVLHGVTLFGGTTQVPQPGDHPPSITPIKASIGKRPRAATIRVSRRKQVAARDANTSQRESAVSRSSWLDVWKGRKHNVLWGTFDGQLMSLWKKRTDKFPEYIFHVSSITNIHQEDRGRFSLYFRKKHLDFMAHSEDVQKGWLKSLLASRGREPPASPQCQGSLMLKEPRGKVYAAICGHNLWIYSNKEDFNLGLGTTIVSMNVASVKKTGRHNFSLVTPFKVFNFSTDSSRDLNMWLDHLNEVIRSALSCSEVALRLWSIPWNKVCADCGGPNPEWASINLLVVICEACAGVHRSLGSGRSKVRSLKLDLKIWTEPLLQLFEIYGNKAASKVWAHNVPAAEQMRPDATPDQRSVFIDAKYGRGLYRKAHPLAYSQSLLNTRLCEVVRGADVEETLSLLCSGARVQGGEGPSAVSLAENCGQALQTELLRHNEFVEVPDFSGMRQMKEQTVTGMEELHGRLDDERFLFSEENESAACDVLDLTEVLSIFDQSSGQTHGFEMLTLTDTLCCTADTHESLLSHMLHVIRVVMPGPLADDELDGVMAVSRLFMREGSGLQHAEVWATVQKGAVFIYPSLPHCPRSVITLNQHTHYSLGSENTITVSAAEQTWYLQFEHEQSCSRFFTVLSKAVSNGRKWSRRSIYGLPVEICGSIPPEVQRCISHITLYGLKVEGLYRCSGTASRVSQLVEELKARPVETVLQTGEESVVEVTGALKHFVRQPDVLIPSSALEGWSSAAVLEDGAVRLQEYRRLVKLLPPDNRITLATLLSHLYEVQLHSQVNRMTAYNLAVVFAPTLFRELAFSDHVHMVKLTNELILHQKVVFLSKEEVKALEEDMITVF